jgi:transposase InsO family protein
MSWKEISPVQEREQFVKEALSRSLSFTALCRKFKVSRKTGYKFLGRFLKQGLPGLQDRSRAPHQQAHRLSDEVVDRILKVRRRHKSWGPKKIAAHIGEGRPRKDWLVISSVGRILKRHGLVKTRRIRSRKLAPGSETWTVAKEPNDVWTVDFKGKFRMGDGRYCHPLTMMDDASRYVLKCRGLLSQRGELCRPVFEAAFREFGRPNVIRSDNGKPFADCGPGRLSTLSVWWIKLGIWPEQIAVGHPEENGKHERMHRELKRETARPPASNASGQQRRFDRFRAEYNEVRPHEAIDFRRPGELYRPSFKTFPSSLREIEYPGHFEVRRVTTPGWFSWRGDNVYVTATLIGETVGLVEIKDGIWRVYFDSLELGVVNERHNPGPGHLKKVLPMC